jgi:hypothetical protein
MSATTGRSAARIRRRRSSPTRARALANIHEGISLVTAGSCRPTLMPDITNSMRLDVLAVAQRNMLRKSARLQANSDRELVNSGFK